MYAGPAKKTVPVVSYNPPSDINELYQVHP